MKIEYKHPNELIENPRNPNVHTKEQIARLSEIIKYQGFRRPISVSKNTGFVIVGHGRLQAARLLNLESVPVIMQEYANEAQEYADMVADNAIAEWAELDTEKLSAELKMIDLDFDLDLLGIKNFSMENFDLSETFEETTKEKEFKLEIIFPNEMEMQDIHDDLLARGYLVKVR